MAEAAKCAACKKPFDMDEIRPKWLPCFHTACLPCVESLRQKRCPSCHKVRRLSDVWCEDDVQWSQELLFAAAQHLEEAGLVRVLPEHLALLHAMPRLRRVELKNYSCRQQNSSEPPPRFLVPPLNHDGGLHWLRITDALPRETTLLLLRSHGHSLRELWLMVGTDAGEDTAWPLGCSDLAELLWQCGLRSLQILVLVRSARCHHHEAACGAQKATVRKLLPHVNVMCDECDDAPTVDF